MGCHHHLICSFTQRGDDLRALSQWMPLMYSNHTFNTVRVCHLHDIIVIISWSFNSCCSSLNILICGYFSITGNVSVTPREIEMSGNVSSFKLLIGAHTHTVAHFYMPWLGLLNMGRVRPSVIPLIYHQESSRCHTHMQHAVIHSHLPSSAHSSVSSSCWSVWIALIHEWKGWGSAEGLQWGTGRLALGTGGLMMSPSLWHQMSTV